MCGIIGIARFDNRPPPDDVTSVSQALKGLRGRGPDDRHVWAGDGVVLGVSRLAMSDPANGKQPWESADGTRILAFNGEVYSTSTLRADLEGRGLRFRTANDTEVLGGLLRADGLLGLALIDGQYSVAYFDRRRKSLSLARDRFGTHPLYYAMVENGIAFGSSARLVGRIAGYHTIDTAALHFSLAAGGIPDHLSLYEGIRQIRAGYALTVSSDGCRDIAIDPVTFPSAGDETPTLDLEEMRALFDEGVINRCQSDAPLGLLLSGGVDSTAVAASASRQGYAFPAYTISSAARSLDEGPAARGVAILCGHTSHTVALTGNMLAARIAEATAEFGAPIWRTGPFGFDILAERVAADGTKGLLTGDGADELFCGYDVYMHTLIRRGLGRNPTAERLGLFHHVTSTSGIPPGRVLPAAMAPFSYDGADVLYSHTPRWRASTAHASAILSEELRRQHTPETFRNQVIATHGEALQPLSALNRARYLELATRFVPFLISIQSDRPFLGHGVEGRHPFLARSLADLAIRSDPMLMVTALHNKIPVRRSLVRPFLPTFARKPKLPFEPGWLALRDAPLFHELCRDLLSPHSVAESGFFDPDRVSALTTRALSPDHVRPGLFGLLLQVLTCQVVVNE